VAGGRPARPRRAPAAQAGPGLVARRARTSAGTSLRDDRRPELTKLIEEQQDRVARDDAAAAALQRDIEERTRSQVGSDSGIAEQQQRIDQTKVSAGLTAVHGPGLHVRLDDAPRRADGGLPPGARPDDVVVHQQDVQSVVNALWAGGAEAMMIMDMRVISTSAVRCVGNTLLLHGRVYSPPFEIRAIGDPARLRAALDADPGVRLFRDASDAYGLGYDVRTEADMLMPAYQGSLGLDQAQATR
jgi:uncharacterized protein YlxW (UPF0749 family)